MTHTHTHTGAPEAQRMDVLSANFEKMMTKRYALKGARAGAGGNGGVGGEEEKEEGQVQEVKRARVE